MMPISDEILMAYADGALRDGERRAVERHLRLDQSAFDLVLAFRMTADTVREALAGLKFATIPPRLLDIIGHYPQWHYASPPEEGPRAARWMPRLVAAGRTTSDIHQKEPYDMPRPIDKNRPDDETLMAYADDMLEAGEHARVASYLETDEEARAIVRMFERTGKAASRAYGDVIAEPPPRVLVDTIMNASRLRDGSNVVDIAGRGAWRTKVREYAVPLAASIVLAVGGYLGLTMWERRGPQAPGFELVAGPVESGGVVDRLLETRASGDSTLITNEGGVAEAEIVVTASFRDRLGRICREFEATGLGDPASPMTVAVACRASGRWTIEGTARISTIGEAPAKNYNPAAGTKVSPIENILSRLGAKPALSKSEETDLVGRGWK